MKQENYSKLKSGNGIQTPCIINDFHTQRGVFHPDEYYVHTDDKTNKRIMIPIYEIDSFHLLTQFVGYTKYKNRESGDVYLRGQTSLFEKNKIITSEQETLYETGMKPSCFRTTCSNIKVRIEKLKTVIKDLLCDCKDLSQNEDDRLFPLLQHYGIKTYWLDVVDNVWVALWFASHDIRTTIVDERELIHIVKTNNSFSYLFLLVSDAIDNNAKKSGEDYPGIYTGHKTILNDLRRSTPSVYLRPHAQHALMLRKIPKGLCNDYSDLIVGIAKIPVRVTLEWIGHSGLLSAQSLFPSPYYDSGYNNLLDKVKKDPGIINTYGSIQYITSD